MMKWIVCGLVFILSSMSVFAQFPATDPGLYTGRVVYKRVNQSEVEGVVALIDEKNKLARVVWPDNSYTSEKWNEIYYELTDSYLVGRSHSVQIGPLTVDGEIIAHYNNHTAKVKTEYGTFVVDL